MAVKKTCGEKYFVCVERSVWRGTLCGRPAKFKCSMNVRVLDGTVKKVEIGRCGIHARRYEKLEKL